MAINKHTERQFQNMSIGICWEEQTENMFHSTLVKIDPEKQEGERRKKEGEANIEGQMFGLLGSAPLHPPWCHSKGLL